MIHTLFIGVITLFIAYLARYQKCKYGLEVAFAIITLFLAVRYDWGNDYQAYLTMFQHVNDSGVSIFNFYALQEVGGYIEIGWIILNRLLSPLGFFGLVILLTVIEHYILYRFVKKYLPSNLYWAAVGIYLFSPTFMLTGSSMMRQFLAMCIFVVAIEFIIEKKLLWYVMLVLLATTFHSSAYILLPVYFVSYINGALLRRFFVVVSLLFILWIFFAVSFAGNIFEQILQQEQLSKYDSYLEEELGKGGWGLGVLYLNILFIMCMYKIHTFSRQFSIILLIALIGVLLIPLTSLVPLTSRIALYFNLLTIVAYPLFFKSIHNVYLRIGLICGYIAIMLRSFFEFFYSDVWSEHFLVYKSIFSAPVWL